MGVGMDLMIRPLRDAADGVLVEEVSMAAWGEGALETVPSHVSVAIVKENGGVVLLAFIGEVAVGFCWGFWAWDEDLQKWKCASHLAAVRPSYRGLKIGEQLKWAQREYVLGKGFDLMTWTFDPLETLNGALNIRKLGAVNNHYLRNLYGEMETPLERGIPTDRFVATWHLGSARVEARKQQGAVTVSLEEMVAHGGKALNGMGMEKGRVVPIEVDVAAVLAERAAVLLVYVPRDYQAIKQRDLGLALRWRLHTRAVFEAAFAAGYLVTDLVTAETVCAYLLTADLHTHA